MKKFEVGVRDLNTAANMIRRTSSLILQGFDNGTLLCEVFPNQVSVSATNLKSHAKYSMLGKCQDEPFSFLIPPVALDYLRLMNDGELEIHVDDNLGFTIKSLYAKAKFNGQSADGFPLRPEDSPRVQFSVDAKSFYKALSSMEHAMTTEASRFELDGARIYMSPDMIRMSATDGRRMALVELPFNGTISGEAQNLEITIPRYFVEEFGRMFVDDEIVDIRVMARGIQATGRYGDLYSILLRDNYPDIRKIVPNYEHPYQAHASRLGIVGVLRRCAVAAGETRCARITFDADKLVFATDGGTHNASISESFYVGTNYDTPFTIRANVDYALDALQAMKSESVGIMVSEAKRPMVFKPLYAKGDERLFDFTAIIQPIHPPEEESK